VRGIGRILSFDRRQLAILGNRCTANGFGKLASGAGPNRVLDVLDQLQ
jgi:hypothetical protein